MDGQAPLQMAAFLLSLHVPSVPCASWEALFQCHSKDVNKLLQQVRGAPDQVAKKALELTLFRVLCQNKGSKQRGSKQGTLS